MCDRWHRLQSGGSPAIPGLRVGQLLLRKTDNPLRTADRLFTAVTVQSGPTGAEAGFDGVAVGRDGSDGERGTDPRDHVGGTHGAVQQEHLDQLPGSGGVAVDLP